MLELGHHVTSGKVTIITTPLLFTDEYVQDIFMKLNFAVFYESGSVNTYLVAAKIFIPIAEILFIRYSPTKKKSQRSNVPRTRQYTVSFKCVVGTDWL